MKINQPFVVSEIIDGEAVIMNLKSGHYYSTRQTGSLLWTWIEQGVNRREMLARLTVAHSGDAKEIERTVAAFIDQLIAQDLIVEVAANTAASSTTCITESTGALQKTAFVPPELEVYADMRDLLLLDPIHDVDEAGWPTPKPPAPESA